MNWQAILIVSAVVAIVSNTLTIALFLARGTKWVIERMDPAVFKGVLAALVTVGVVAWIVTIIAVVVVIHEDGPPTCEYKIADFMDDDGMISGKLLCDEQPVSGAELQIKIFECGDGEDPLQGPEYPRTDANGEFSVQFSSPLPSCYVVNICHKDPEGEWRCWDY